MCVCVYIYIYIYWLVEHRTDIAGIMGLNAVKAGLSLQLLKLFHNCEAPFESFTSNSLGLLSRSRTIEKEARNNFTN